MTSAIEVLIPTSSQTVGPFVEIGCKYLESDRVVASSPDMVDVVVRGRVIDGDGNVVPDFMLEIWQPSEPAVIRSEAKACPEERERRRDRSPATAVGFARVMPLPDGSFAFHTSYAPPGADDLAPHLTMLVFMRGLLKPVLTRMYFPDDPRNAADPVLALVPADRHATLVATAVSVRDALLELEWNVVLQGADETVFFEW